MNAFFENFTLLLDAPNSVSKLRDLILQLTVEGKLVKQDERDEPASLLAERIQAEKMGMGVKEGLRPTPTMPVEDNEAPYSLPTGWIWTRLVNIGFINPRNQFDDKESASFIPMSFIPQKYGDLVKSETRNWNEIRKGFTHFAEGDVVLAKITPCFQNGKAAVMRGLTNNVGAGTTELHVFRPIDGLINPEYVLAYLKSPKFLSDGIPRMTGTAGQKRVPNDYFANNPFPLPPLPEQARIAAKVHELMRLCDQLDIEQQARRKSRARLNVATLAPLVTSLTLAKFEQAAVRLADQFDTLYDSAGTVDGLRSTILQLAVQGKLAPQDPDDEPASVLLKRISYERERLVKEDRIKKSKALRAIDEIRKPFELPPGWTWTRFPELGEFSRGRSKHRPRNAPELYVGGKFKLVQTGDVARANGVIRTYSALYNEKGLAQSRIWPEGTMCITIAANIADSGILGFDACFPDSVVGFIPSKIIGNAQYFEFFVRTAKSHLQDFAPSTAQKNINVSILEEVLIPLPPLKEQERIVAKVNHLMALCDELESKLRQAEADSEKLMNAAVQYVLSTVETRPHKELSVRP